MSERAPYSRIYWSVLSDPKFVGIRTDMRHFGSWSMLLMVADMAYPAPAFVPPVIPKASRDKLIEVGLVDVLEDGMVRLHGLEAERERRREAATSKPKRDPSGTQTGTERSPLGQQAKPSLAEPSQDEAEAPREDEDPADIYWRLTGKYPGDTVLPWIDQLTNQYGSRSVTVALVNAFTADKSTRTLLGRTQDNLRAGARELDRAEKAAEKARLAEKRAQPRRLEPWQEEFRQRIEEQYRGAA
jgi:hypothetical protein